MATTFLQSIKQAVKHWYIPLLVGVFFIVVSIIAFTSPVSSLLTLSILFALSFLFGGVSEVIFSLVNKHQLENWGWSLAFGIITFLAGFSLLIHPSLSISVLAFYIGFTVLFRSVASISFALAIWRVNVGTERLAKMEIIAITTINSKSVKPRMVRRVGNILHSLKVVKWVASCRCILINEYPLD